MIMLRVRRYDLQMQVWNIPTRDAFIKTEVAETCFTVLNSVIKRKRSDSDIDENKFLYILK